MAKPKTARGDMRWVRTKRPLVDNGDGTHSVPLADGRFAIVDSDDAAYVGQWNWCVTAGGGGDWPYATRSVQVGHGRSHRRRITVRLHRDLMGAADGTEVDHINGNTLDNRRSNLRMATSSQNKWNTRLRRDNRTGYRGVRKRSDCERWAAEIAYKGRRTYLGSFPTPEAANAAYSAAADRLYGEFRRKV